MAQDNPFLSFFESVGTGMEAGAGRRSLMQRAEQGEDVEVPGLGRTILSAVSRAATPANTRLAQDQLKIQAANYALQIKATEDRQAAIDAQNYYKNTLEAKEAELEAKNSMIYTQAVVEDRQLAQSGKWNDFDATIAPEGMGAALTDKYYAQKRLTGEEFDRQNFLELSDNKDLLVDSGSYTPESVTQMSPDAVKAAAQTMSGRYGKLDDMLLYIPFDQRASVKTQVLTGTPDQKREAWAMLDRASIEVSSSIGKIQQDIKKLKAEGGADNLASAQQLQRYADNLGKGDESPSYTITKDENGKTTIQVIGGPNKDLSATERSDLREASRSYQELKTILDKAERQVRESPEAFGAPGELTGLINKLKAVAAVLPGVEFTQNMNRRQVETTMDTLVTQVLPALAGTSLGRMTENDAKLLKAPLPKLEWTNTAGVVERQLDALRFRVSLAYIIGRESGGSLQGILDEEGPVEFARLISRAKSEGFGREERTLERAVDQAIRDIAEKPQSEADSDLKAMLLELQRSGKFTKDELKSLILNNPALD